MKQYDVIVIGGGPAGLAASLEAVKNGAERVVIIERDKELGGILNQCIHNGFGLHFFKEELTGPEYAGRFIARLQNSGIEVMLDTMVVKLEGTVVRCVNSREGYIALEAGAVVLAMGCRERTRGAIGIPGYRPAGIFTAGAAQRYMNMEGYTVGKRVVILGSGDIGLIMARRMTLEGAEVLACVELMPYSNGLNRNIVQCLDDYQIPLYLSHTITEIRGRERVEGVVISEVDSHRRPVPGTEQYFVCDTVLLSVGLIPENELSRNASIEIDPHTNGPVVYESMETSVPGVFGCGNVVHVHDLVDFVTGESQKAGKYAALHALNGNTAPGNNRCIQLEPGSGVSYSVPQKLRPGRLDKACEVFFRVRMICHNAVIIVRAGDRELLRFKRDHMAPGEMERIMLPRTVVEQADEVITILVEVPS